MTDAESGFCRKCISQGNYTGPLNADDLVVETVATGDTSVQFVKSTGSRWCYSTDQGPEAGTQAAENINALSPKQVKELGGAVVTAVRERRGCNRGQNTCAFSAELVDATATRLLGRQEKLDRQANF